MLVLLGLLMYCKLWRKPWCKGENSGTINRKFIATHLHTAVFLLLHRAPYCSARLKNRLLEKETRFIQPVSKCGVWIDKEREKYFRDFLLTQMNLQLGRRRPTAVSGGTSECSLVDNTRIDPPVRKVFGRITVRAISVGVIVSSNQLGARWRLRICVVSFDDRSNCALDDACMNNLWATIADSYTYPPLVILLACMLHYSEMFFIAIGKMPSISNGRASACHVGRVSSGTFVRLVRPVLLLLLGTWGAAVFLLPPCKRRTVLCFSRDANHEIPLDKLIYFSRCFSLFEMYGLMYSILGTASPFKKYPVH